MNIQQLWEKKNEDGDVMLKVGNSRIRAHWNVIKNVAYFKAAADSIQEIQPDSINIEHISYQTLQTVLQYIYLECSFINDNNDCQLLDFCHFVRSQSLSYLSFRVAMKSLTDFNCFDSYRVGHAFHLSPLKHKAWKVAVELGLESVIECMVNFSNNIIDNIISHQLQTALHISIERGYRSQAKTLIKLGADTSLRDYQKRTALGLAAWYNYIDVVQLLLDYGADAHATDIWRQTALQTASSKGNTDIVRLLLSYDFRINERNRNGYTALHLAAMGGYYDTVTILMEHGADWGVCDDQWQQTALHMAAWRGHSGLITQLSSLCNYEAETTNGLITPLHTAVKSKQFEVVDTLLSHNVSVNSQDWRGRTPLHYACLAGESQLVNKLLYSGADQSIQDKYDMTCLHLAASYDQTSIVTTLILFKNTRVNAVDSDGLTALHYAMANSNVTMIRQLLRAGAIPTMLSRNGYIAQNMVGKVHHVDTIKTMIITRA